MQGAMARDRRHNGGPADGPGNASGRERGRRPRGPRQATPKYLRNSALYYLERYASSSAHLRRLLLAKRLPAEALPAVGRLPAARIAARRANPQTGPTAASRRSAAPAPIGPDRSSPDGERGAIAGIGPDPGSPFQREDPSVIASNRRWPSERTRRPAEVLQSRGPGPVSHRALRRYP